MKSTVATLLIASAATASADAVDPSRVTVLGTDQTTGFTTLELDMDGLHHYSSKGFPANDTFFIPLDTDAEVVGLSFDFNVTTIGVSLVSDARIAMENIWPSLGDLAIDINAGVSASNSNYAYPLFMFSDFGLAPLSAGADGIYTMELYDTSVNNGGAGDLVYEAGSTMTLVVSGYVPAPSSIALVGAAALVSTRRRR